MAYKRSFIEAYYRDKLNGMISPVWLSQVKWLGREGDENIYLAVKMRNKNQKSEYAS